ncbi:hypothetical protein [Phenylobacterium sp.]|uniref:HNH endonuclease n=1 Tax=Phenylobacterium sp. TaxID=1871053 RepID=UPI0035AEA618
MAKEQGGAFEFDEPAARSHSPPGWPIHTLEIKPDGKAPKQHGPNTYRFGAALTLSVILPRRGWTLVKKTKNYAYLIPPPDQLERPFQITIAVPPDEECLAIANRSFTRGESWMGQLGEWPAWYFHERNMNMQRLERDRTTGAMIVEVIEQPPKSILTIGEFGVWERVVTAIGGRFGLGHLPPDFPFPPVATSPEPEQAPLRSPPLWEGAPVGVELTKYERSREARRQCIDHYGPTCQACTLTYEEKYGAIGAELIHVHHLTPLSEISEAYEVDPVCDLVPLCATCHHVVHSRIPPYSVEEVRRAIHGARPDGQ